MAGAMRGSTGSSLSFLCASRHLTHPSPLEEQQIAKDGVDQGGRGVQAGKLAASDLPWRGLTALTSPALVAFNQSSGLPRLERLQFDFLLAAISCGT